jgi:hypothetical protein
METIKILFAIFCLGVFVYVGVTFYMQYRAQVAQDTKTGVNRPTWRRLLQAAEDSETILWNKFVILLAAGVADLNNFLDLIGASDLKQYVNDIFGSPKIVAAVAMAIAVISIMARRART